MALTVAELDAVLRFRDEASDALAALTKTFDKVAGGAKGVDEALQTLGASTTKSKDLIDRIAEATKQFSETGKDAAEQAKVYALAIDDIGGVNRLTLKDQQAVNKIVNEALDYYRAIGEKAPQYLKDLEEATRKIKPPTEEASNSVGLLLKRFATGLVTGAAIKSTVDYADSLGNLSKQTGISIEALQRLDFAASQNGSSLQAVTAAVGQFQNRLAGGDQALTTALDALGLSFQAIAALSPEEQFLTIADAIAEVEDPAKRAQLATDLFGKSGRELLPAITSDMRKLGEQAAIMGNETVRNVGAAGSSFDSLIKTGKVLIGAVLSPFAPVLKAVADGLSLITTWAGRAGSAIMSLTFVGNATKIWDDFDTALRQIGIRLQDIPKVTGPAAAGVEKWKEAARKRASETGLLDALANEDAIIKDLDKTIAENQKAIEAAAKAAEDYRREITALSEQFSGANLLGDLKKIGDAWRLVPDPIKATAAAQDLLMKSLQPIIERFGPGALPKDLQAVRDAYFNLKVPLIDLNALIGAQTIEYTKNNPIVGEASVMAAVLTSKLQGVTDRLYEQAPAAAKAADETNLFATATEAAAEQSTDWTTALGIVGEALGGISQQLDLGIDLVLALGKALKTANSDTASFAENLSTTASVIGLFFAATRAYTESQMEEQHRALVKRIQERGEEYGLTLSYAIAEGLIGDPFERQVAEMIQGLGGVTKYNIDQFAAIVAEDLGVALTMIAIQARTGADMSGLFLDLEASAKQVEEVFPQLADVIVRNNRLAGESFLEIIANEKELGLQTEAVTAFIKDRMGSAISGLITALGSAANASQALRDAQARLAELEAAYADASGPQKEKIAADIAKVTAEILKQQQIIDVTSVTTQAAATGMVGAIAAAFNELQARGVPLREILEQLEPAILALDEQMIRAGLDGGGAFDEIKRLAKLASDEIAGPAFDAISGLNQVLIALQQSGALNQETFEGLARQVADTYNKLITQGKDGDDALRLMQPTLQTIWELQQKYGYEVDEATQALLDQAVAAGVVGEAQMDAQEQVAAAMTEVVDILTAIAVALGATLPAAAQQGADAITDAINSIPTDIEIDVTYNEGDGPGGPGGLRDGDDETPGYQTGTGGRYIDFGGGTLAMLHGKEKITPAAGPGSGGDLDYAAMLRELRIWRQQDRDLPSLIALKIRDALQKGRAA